MGTVPILIGLGEVTPPPRPGVCYCDNYIRGMAIMQSDISTYYYVLEFEKSYKFY